MIIIATDDIFEDGTPQIVFIGRSNVGKSSLINHLVMQKGLARVGASPGRTQTINLFEIDKRYFLVDLPGYGFAKMSKNKRSGSTALISLSGLTWTQISCTIHKCLS